jgi:hypothetical protein
MTGSFQSRKEVVAMVRLKVSAYLAIAADRGHRTVEQRAHAAGIGMGTVSRITNGSPVGNRVMSRLMSTYDVGFDELFLNDVYMDTKVSA